MYSPLMEKEKVEWWRLYPIAFLWETNGITEIYNQFFFLLIYKSFRLQNTQNSLQRNQIRMETNRQKNPTKRLSQSQESINHLYYTGPKVEELLYHKSDLNIANFNFNDQMVKNSRNLLR